MKNLIKAALLVVLLSVSGNAFSKPILISDKEKVCSLISRTVGGVNNEFHSKSRVDFRRFIDNAIVSFGGSYTAYGLMNYSAELVINEDDIDTALVEYTTYSRCKSMFTDSVILELNRLDEDSRIPAFLGYMVHNIDFNK